MSLSVVPAVGAVLERILDDTFPLWHDGLTRPNYGRYWAAQLKTGWGQAHLSRVALQDGPHVVASAKRLDLPMQIDGRIRRVLGIGAVFFHRIVYGPKPLQPEPPLVENGPRADVDVDRKATP